MGTFVVGVILALLLFMALRSIARKMASDEPTCSCGESCSCSCPSCEPKIVDKAK